LGNVFYTLHRIEAVGIENNTLFNVYSDDYYLVDISTLATFTNISMLYSRKYKMNLDNE